MFKQRFPHKTPKAKKLASKANPPTLRLCKHLCPRFSFPVNEGGSQQVSTCFGNRVYFAPLFVLPDGLRSWDPVALKDGMFGNVTNTTRALLTLWPLTWGLVLRSGVPVSQFPRQ